MFAVGDAITVAPVATLSEPAGVQEYVVAPLAVNVDEPVTQIPDVEGETATVGYG